MKDWMTFPRIAIALCATIAVCLALHARSTTQPNITHSGAGVDVQPSDPSENGFIAEPDTPVDNGFFAERYKPVRPVSAAMVRGWLALLRAENDGSAVFAQGIANLEGLLASMPPEQSVLLPNYPNPFNPETWIPYQLSHAAAVTVSIYAADGRRVRTLALGHQVPGVYESQSRAAYWDGRNDVGERVASGVYFYTLSAGTFRATRKMLIMK